MPSKSICFQSFSIWDTGSALWSTVRAAWEWDWEEMVPFYWNEYENERGIGNPDLISRFTYLSKMGEGCLPSQWMREVLGNWKTEEYDDWSMDLWYEPFKTTAIALSLQLKAVKSDTQTIFARTNQHCSQFYCQLWLVESVALIFEPFISYLQVFSFVVVPVNETRILSATHLVPGQIDELLESNWNQKSKKFKVSKETRNYFTRVVTQPWSPLTRATLFSVHDDFNLCIARKADRNATITLAIDCLFIPIWMVFDGSSFVASG